MPEVMPTAAELTLMRVDRFLLERLAPHREAAAQPLVVTAWEAPGEPVPFAEATAHEGVRVEPGHAWGAPWSTTWLHLTGPAPVASASGAAQVVVDLGFTDVNPGFQAEGQFWSADGRPLKGLNPRNRALSWPVGEPVDVWVEAAGNPTVLGHVPEFQPTTLGERATAGTDPLYVLRRADLVTTDAGVEELWHDALALRDLLRVLPADGARYARVLRALDRLVAVVDPDDVPGTAAEGRKVLAPALEAPANASAHQAYAVGHAHIDSAWLWPVRETVRKAARTFSTVVTLMDEDPDLVFACSSAQQYAWIKESYPDLFERIKAKVAEGRWVPVGGMWVESDTNMPGGEAMVRQFLTGKSFFSDELGVETLDVWLPDSFGYSGALPQIAKLAGNRWMLTQKLSWNETNAMPHHTFLWEGIDGTRLLTHFPPVDSYNAELAARELDHAARNNREKGELDASIVPFGYGDGGGGPTTEMLARARRYASTEGVAEVRVASPYDFFEAAEAELERPAVWSGEMYLEFHRGTYTSQARTKQGNRRSEHLLREAELWAATAAVRAGVPYPHEAIDQAWKTVLLNQFHDILPGSSIAWVYRDAEAGYADVARTLEEVVGTSLAALAGSGEVPLVFNASPHARDGVAALGAAPVAGAQGPDVTVSDDDAGGRVLANGLVAVHVDARGLVDSIRDLRADREVVPAGLAGNLLQLHRDTPRQWDAWDIDHEYLDERTDLVDALGVEVVESSADEVVVEVRRAFGASAVRQRLSLARGSAALTVETVVDWHERQKLLKLAFPLAVHADRSASETQFGHVFRPTHANTPWDAAKFEICAHRWVHVAEPGYGVAVANSATYGHDVQRTVTDDGATVTTVRESLLRAPLFPDPDADQGEHRFVTVLHVGADLGDAVRDGYAANLPARVVAGAGPVEPLVTVDDPAGAVLVESVKLAEDRSGDVVVRLYESLGGHARATVRPGFETSGATRTDLLERPLEQAGTAAIDLAEPLALRPFEIVTLRFARP
ncbi:MAG TPA: glycoside hydrolase family 38 C-terminal domain-containing protein [Luteimicrobium sp.]|nr:glycoside hydrolase family 38 C-terminal domain-containing protein [Luteimicrobium sp.]